MPLKIRVKGSLFHCGRCGKRHSNPLGHVCQVTRPAGRMTVRPEVTVSTGTCGRCGKPRGRGPLGHVCTGGGDFARRAAAEKKAVTARKRAAAAAARQARPKHEYARCKDTGCERAACQAYREGVADGLELAAAAESRS